MNTWRSTSLFGETCWWSRHHVSDASDVTDDAAPRVCTCSMHLLRTTGSILEKAPWCWSYSDQTRWMDTALAPEWDPSNWCCLAFTTASHTSERAAFSSGNPGRDRLYTTVMWADQSVSNLFTVLVHFTITIRWWTGELVNWCIPVFLALHKQHTNNPCHYMVLFLTETLLTFIWLPILFY